MDVADGMDPVAGMTPTGRRVAAPDAELVEAIDGKGLKHTALVIGQAWRDDPALTDDLLPRLSFLERPGVPGVAPLAAHVPAAGSFVYPCGAAWSVAEVVRVFAEQGTSCGIRAGLELGYLAAEILSEAVDVASGHGLACHGQVDPWRVVIKADGRVELIGYGISPVAALADPPVEEALRYAPPERATGEPEDLSSDLFSLALVVAELMLGRPVYDGKPEDIARQAGRADALRRFYLWRDELPESVREALARAVRPDVDARYRNGVDFVYALHDLLGSLDAEGPSLVQVMERFRDTIKEGRSFRGGQTGALNRAELAELARDRARQPTPLPAPRHPRPDPGAEDVRQQPSGPLETEEVSPREQLRERLRSRALATDGGAPSDRERLLERLKQRSEPADDASGPRRRPRRLGRRIPKKEVTFVDDEPTERPVVAKEEPVPVLESASGTRAAELLARLRGVARPAGLPKTPMEPAVSKPKAPAPSERSWRVALPGAEPVRRPLDTAASCCETARQLAVEAHLLPVDLTGTLQGWYVLSQDGVRVRGDTPTADLDWAKPVDLVLAPNEVVLLTIEVAGSEPPMRVRTPVGTAVPACAVLAHLRGWLALDDDDLGLWVEGTRLLPWQLLGDFTLDADTAVVVSR